MLLDSNLFFLSVISSNSQKFFRNYPPDLIISIGKNNNCLQIFPVNLASITGNLPFFDISNLTEIFWNYPPKFHSSSKSSEMENVFQISPAEKKTEIIFHNNNPSDIRQSSNFFDSRLPLFYLGPNSAFTKCTYE